MGLLVAGGVLAAFGWAGVYFIVMFTLPRPGPRWLFFVMLHMAITGTVLPIVRYTNVRLTRLNRPLPGSGILIRQATWVGLFVVTCAWLQITRILNGPIAFLLAVGFAGLEGFLRYREVQDEL